MYLIGAAVGETLTARRNARIASAVL